MVSIHFVPAGFSSEISCAVSAVTGWLKGPALSELISLLLFSSTRTCRDDWFVFCNSDIFRKVHANIYKAYASRSKNCYIDCFPGFTGRFKKKHYMTGSAPNPSSTGLVYCIIVTYNGIAWVEKCLNSLIRSSYPLTVLVVDNCSTDSTVPTIRENFPQVRLIGTEKNLGFGQANNIGMQIALEEGASHVFLLNQDAWVEKDTILDLVNAQLKDPRFGILSPVHLNGAGTALDHYFSGYLLRSDLKEWVGAALLGRSLLSPVISTSFVNAAAWLISAECLRRTGGFDPIFFHYGEDLNYSQRVLYHNFLIGIHMDTRICHDRELRLAGPVATAIQRKRDKIHFLNQACDIRHAGYWTRLPYAGARWVAPRYEGQRYYTGYWEGDRGRVEHDHRWDRDRNRDYRDRR